MTTTRIRGARTISRIGLPITALLLATAAMPAQAQAVPAPASPDQQEATTSNAPTQPTIQVSQDEGLGTIVVTATKRETNLQRTPIAISVANAQALTDRHAQSILDLGDGSIPSLRVAT